MLHRLITHDFRPDETAIFESFVRRVRVARTKSAGQPLGESMANAWADVLDEVRAEKAGHDFARGRGAVVPFSFGPLFGASFTPVDHQAARRARLLRFIKNYGDPYRQFRLRLGEANVRHDCLTDDALEDLCADMVQDFWRRRKIRAENRAAVTRRRALQAAG